MVQITAAAVHQARDQGISRWPGTGHCAAQRTGAIVQIDGFVTVLFNQSLHISSDNVVGFFPANTLEFAFTARPDAFHRIFQAIWVINATTHRTPTQTGAYLMQAVVIVITGIIRFDVFDFTVHDMHSQWAAATAVNCTCAPDNLLVRICHNGVIDSVRYSTKR